MPTLREQIKANRVALISLAVALLSLGYNTWRNETTEEQRNVRHAAFRVLEGLGALQEVVDHRHYYLPFEPSVGKEAESRLQGFGEVRLVQDLTGLMPEPAPDAGAALFEAWNTHFGALDDLAAGTREPTPAADAAEATLTSAIDRTRTAVLQVLAELE